MEINNKIKEIEKPLIEKIKSNILILCAFKNDQSEGNMERFIEVTEKIENDIQKEIKSLEGELKEEFCANTDGSFGKGIPCNNCNECEEIDKIFENRFGENNII